MAPNSAWPKGVRPTDPLQDPKDGTISVLSFPDPEGPGHKLGSQAEGAWQWGTAARRFRVQGTRVPPMQAGIVRVHSSRGRDEDPGSQGGSGDRGSPSPMLAPGSGCRDRRGRPGAGTGLGDSGTQGLTARAHAPSPPSAHTHLPPLAPRSARRDDVTSGPRRKCPPAPPCGAAPRP